MPFFKLNAFAAESPKERIKRSYSDTHSRFDPWIEIRSDHVVNNVQEINRQVENRPILAVIKNNGYGMGLVNIAQILEDLNPIKGYAVVKLNEAFTLRDAGLKKPILHMGSFSEDELEEMIHRNITPMVYTPIGSMFDRMAEKFQRSIPVHMCVDTGLGRVGVPHHQAGELIEDFARRNSVEIEGTMMTFTEDPDFDRVQIERFKELIAKLKSKDVPVGMMHAASTTPIFMHHDAYFDMVRPGMGIYGIYPQQEQQKNALMNLLPAMSVKGRVLYVKKIRKGESAGYGRTYVAEDDVWIATLPIGHADGYQRRAAGCAKVRINEKLYPVIASVSASHCIVEIGKEQEVHVGDTAIFYDWQDGSRPEDINAACDISVYDLTMHLSPLIPKLFV